MTVIAPAGSYAADEILLHRATEELIRRCMSARGERYAVQRYEPTSMSSLTDDEAHPDMVWRRHSGYWLSPDLGAKGRGENDRHVATLTPARRATWDRTLTGDGTKMSSVSVPSGQIFTGPTNGCIAESGRELYGSPEEGHRAFYFLQDVRVRLGDSVRGDAAYTSAVARWAACMRGRDHVYPTPSSARDAISARYARAGATPAVRRLEVAVAVADAECVAAADLTATANALVRTRADGYAAEIRQEINRSAAIRLRGVEQAKKLLHP